MISIIIPTRNKDDINPTLLTELRSQCEKEDEIIIIEGNSRGKQLNTGAKDAQNSILFFCHDDSEVPKGTLTLIRRHGTRESYCGAFSLKFASTSLLMRWLGVITTIRSILTRTPYGDQGLFLSKRTFTAIGGFPNSSFLEDIEFINRAKRQKVTIEIHSKAIKTSPKRYEKNGIFRQVFINRLVILGHLLGVDKKALKKLYR